MPSILRKLSNLAKLSRPSELLQSFSCDRAANCFIAILGPALVVVALALVSGGVFVLFQSILPYQLRDSNIYTWIAHGVFAAWLVVLISFNYYGAIVTSPGTPELAETRDSLERDSSAQSVIEMEPSQMPSVSVKQCKKCLRNKYERTHHCSVCKQCVNKMDHHCPWINVSEISLWKLTFKNCVGNDNHRYFYLFTMYLWIGLVYYSIMCFRPFMSSFYEGWGYDLEQSHKGGVVLFFMLSGSMTLAVGFLAVAHTYFILTNQTTIEFYKNRFPKDDQGPVAFTAFDLGTRRNFTVFFNIGKRYSWWYMLLPVRVPPSSDGKTYPTLRTMRRLNLLMNGQDDSIKYAP